MAFCTNCGSPVTGQFCTKCGARMGVPGQTANPPPLPAASGRPVNIEVHTAPGAPSPTGARKRGPLFWVLAVCLVVVVIGVILAVSTGIFLVNKAKQAGIDPALMQKNPGLAVAKMIAAMNPEIEVLEVDEDQDIIRVRNKKDGKILTVNLADAKDGKIVFEDENRQRVEFEAKGEGDQASLAIKTREGTIRMGPGAGQLPDWLPLYPGAEVAGALTGMESKEDQVAYCTFKTEDSPNEVATFYENVLSRAGFKVERTAAGDTIAVAAKQSSSGRTVHVTASREADMTAGHIMVEDKKKKP